MAFRVQGRVQGGGEEFRRRFRWVEGGGGEGGFRGFRVRGGEGVKGGLGELRR